MSESNSRDWVPVVRGWHSFPEVAAELGVRRQRVFQMLDEGKLTSARRLPGSGDRPAAYMISSRELARLKAEQKSAAEGTEDADAGELVAAP